MFSYQNCKFRVEPDKIGTGRVVVWKEFKVTNSFTLESSFRGYEHGKLVKDFDRADYRKQGVHLCETLEKYRMMSAQIDKELELTKGWLKPKFLL